MSLSIGVIVADEVVCSRLCSIINSSPYCALEGIAINELEARALMKKNNTDVYLIDLGLPNVNGIDLISSIKTSCKYAKIMVVTNFGDSRHVVESIRAGASGYLLENDVNPDFHEKIMELSNGFQQISNSLIGHLFGKICGKPYVSSNYFNNLLVFNFTGRELEVLKYLVDGIPILIMANILGRSVHTVNQHLRSIYKKLNVHSRSMAISVVASYGFSVNEENSV